MAQVEADMQRTSYSPKGKFDDSKYDDDDDDDDFMMMAIMMMRFLDVIGH